MAMNKTPAMLLDEFLDGREILKELRKTVAFEGKKSFVIEFDRLLEFSLEMAKWLIDDPVAFLKQADEKLVDITKLPGMRLRVRGLDRSVDADKVRAKHLGKFIQIEGVVTWANRVRLEVKVLAQGDFEDYQRIRIDGDIDVELRDDLAGTVNQGDEVCVTGIVRPEPAPPRLWDKLLVANHIEKKRQDGTRKVEEEIYLTEMSLKELLEGKPIYEDDGRIIIYPPRTNELGNMKKQG